MVIFRSRSLWTAKQRKDRRKRWIDNYGQRQLGRIMAHGGGHKGS